MKILVTGGAGFIGSALVRHIIFNTRDHVVNVDALTYAGNPESISTICHPDRYAFEHVDIRDQKRLTGVFARHRPDVVMHLAAESHVDRSIDGPADFISTNIVGTYTLLEVCRSYYQSLDARAKASFRFHHVSSDEVYGELGPKGMFTEASPYLPGSPYSASKASSDHLVRAWQRTYGLPTLISACTNNYGPYQFPEKLIPLVILNALDEKPLPVYGDGLHIRDWLYVEDHVRALYLIATAGRVGESYNISANNEVKNIDLVKAICVILDELRPLGGLQASGYASLIKFVADRPGHDRRYAVDASKIRRELGWRPEESFEAGIRKTVEWYLSNSEWLQGLQTKS